MSVKKKENELAKAQNISLRPEDLALAIKLCQIEDRNISSLFRRALKEYAEHHYPDGVK